MAKAPQFDKMQNFNQEGNGLFKLHVYVDTRGFVWANLDGEDKPSVSWQSDFHGADAQPRLGMFNMDEYTFDHTWDMDGDYNWKTLVDNYNEV